jgi:NitT/TauT family transport system ATP-binding protein
MDLEKREEKITIKNVCKVFDTPQGSVEAIRELNLFIQTNEIVCLVGPSGCGKSTLLNLVAGFIHPTEGEVLIGDKRVTSPGADRAVVFQQDSVFPWLTVYKNLEYGPKARGVPEEKRKQMVDRLLLMIDMAEYKNFLPRQLSGGMKKRVDLARAYANQPEVLLMDEPFGALDVFTKEKMQRNLISLWQQEPRTVLFITHDIEEALFIGQRVAVMSARPARIVGVIDVPFDKTTDTQIKTSPEFQSLRQKIIDMLGQSELNGIDNGVIQ